MKEKCKHGVWIDEGHYCIHCVRELLPKMTEGDLNEIRVILYRLVDYLEGNWKVWLPYLNEEKQMLALATKFKDFAEKLNEKEK